MKKVGKALCRAVVSIACSWVAGVSEAALVHVQYIRSTKAQCLQTDYVPNEKTKLVFDLEMEGDAYQGGGSTILFNVPETTYRFSANFGGGSAEASTLLYCWPWKYYELYKYMTVESLQLSESIIRDRNTFRFGQGRCEWGSEGRDIHANPTAAEHVFAQRLVILGMDVDTPFTSRDVKLYGLKIFEDDAVVRDYVPVVCDGVAGLYDNMGKTFFGSTTDVAFEAGPTFNAIAVEAIPTQLLYGTAAVEPHPEVSVVTTNGIVALVEGKDYALTWANNTAVGTGAVTVHGINSFSGFDDVTADFEIIAAPYEDDFIVTDAEHFGKTETDVLVTYVFTNAAESVLKMKTRMPLVDLQITGGGGETVYLQIKRSLDVRKCRRLVVGEGRTGGSSAFELDDGLRIAFGGADGDVRSGAVVMRFLKDKVCRLVQSIKTTRAQGIQTDYVPNADTKLVFDMRMFGEAYQPSGSVLFYVPETVYRYTANFGGSNAEGYTLYCWPWKYYGQGWTTIQKKEFSQQIVTARNTFSFGQGYCVWKNEWLAVHANPTREEHVFQERLFVLGESAEKPFSGWNVELYGFKIYEGDLVVREYLPTLRNGVAGLLEVNSGSFFGSATGTDFEAGSLCEGFDVESVAKQLLLGESPCEPHPSVRLDEGSSTLVEGTDYELVWANNTAVGTGTVTVCGISTYADYADTSVDFEIVAPSYLDDYIATDAKGVVKIKSAAYMTYVFTNVADGVLRVQTSSSLADMLVVGGGGGGGFGYSAAYAAGDVGGGGGGGGVVWREVGASLDLHRTRRLKVGGGGAGSNADFDLGLPGGISVFDLDDGVLTAYGGSGGGSSYAGSPDAQGTYGSAGGAANGVVLYGAYTVGQGNRGGKAGGKSGGGGGGGAMSAGGDGLSGGGAGGDGGAGFSCAITGVDHCYGSGGGGGGRATAGCGGQESGGDGGADRAAGSAGVDGLGGGGGGGGRGAPGGAGGSGVVILRFVRQKKGLSVFVR